MLQNLNFHFFFYRSPVIVLRDIPKSHIKAILTYIYEGEVDIKQCEIADFMKSAECLHIKGLVNNYYKENSTNDAVSEGKIRKNDAHSSSSSPPKKKYKKLSDKEKTERKNIFFLQKKGVKSSNSKSSSTKNISQKDGDLKSLPFVQINVKNQDLYDDPLKINDNVRDDQNILGFRSEGTVLDVIKQEHDLNLQQNEFFTHFMDAESSGLQEVSFIKFYSCIHMD